MRKATDIGGDLIWLQWLCLDNGGWIGVSWEAALWVGREVGWCRRCRVVEWTRFWVAEEPLDRKSVV